MDEGNWTFLNEWMTLDVLKKFRKFQCVSINQQTTQPPNHTTTNLHHQTTPPPTHTTTNPHHHQPTPPPNYTTKPHHHQPTPPTTHTTNNPHHHQPTPPPACIKGVHWKCGDRKECVYQEFVCDGEKDCEYGEDESREACGELWLW